MTVVVVVPPAPIVTIDEAKRHLKQDSDDDAVFITSLVAAATGHIDGPNGWLGRSIGVQTLEASAPTWCVAENFRLPYPPLISVEQISYRDANRQTVVVSADAYEVVDGLVEAIGEPAWSGAHPARSGMRIRYRAGYAPIPASGDTPAIDTVPAQIKAAILLMVGDLYRNRDTTSGTVSAKIPMSTTVETLLDPFRVFR